MATKKQTTTNKKSTTHKVTEPTKKDDAMTTKDTNLESEAKDAETTQEPKPAKSKRGRKPGQKVLPHDQHKQIAKLNEARDKIVAKYEAQLNEIDAEIEKRYMLQVERDAILTERERKQTEWAEKRTATLLETERNIQESLAKIQKETNAPEIDPAELTTLGVDDDELIPLEVADISEIILD